MHEVYNIIENWFFFNNKGELAQKWYVILNS